MLFFGGGVVFLGGFLLLFFLSSIILCLLLFIYTKQGGHFKQMSPEFVAKGKWIFSDCLKTSVLFLTYRFLS